MMDVYESPTFLSQKDKYFMGLSMVQMLGVIGIAFVIFFLSLMVPVGLVMRLIGVVIATLITSVLVFGRMAGLSIPGYLLLMLLSPLRRTVYEEEPEVLLAGSSEFLAVLAEKEARAAESRGDGWVARGRDFATSEDAENRRNEIKAEMNKGIVEGASTLEGMVKDGIRGLKGG